MFTEMSVHFVTLYHLLINALHSGEHAVLEILQAVYQLWLEWEKVMYWITVVWCGLFACRCCSHHGIRCTSDSASWTSCCHCWTGHSVVCRIVIRTVDAAHVVSCGDGVFVVRVTCWMVLVVFVMLHSWMLLRAWWTVSASCCANITIYKFCRFLTTAFFIKYTVLSQLMCTKQYTSFQHVFLPEMQLPWENGILIFGILYETSYENGHSVLNHTKVGNCYIRRNSLQLESDASFTVASAVAGWC